MEFSQDFPDVRGPFPAGVDGQIPLASGPQFFYTMHPQDKTTFDLPFDPSLDILPPGDMSELSPLAFNPAEMPQFNTFAPPHMISAMPPVPASTLGVDASNSSGTSSNPATFIGSLQPTDSGGSGAPPKRGGRRSTRTPEEKAAATQEKNRRAQKRFRERQRCDGVTVRWVHTTHMQHTHHPPSKHNSEKMINMEDSVSLLAEQVKQLSTENNNLNARNSVLEKVLSLREEQIQTYQQHQKVYDFGATTPDMTGKAGKSLACAVPLEVVTHGQDPIKTIQSKSVEEVTAQWKGYVKEMANLLIEYEHADEAGRPALHTHICKLIASAGQLCMLTAMFSPVHIKKMLAATASSEERHLQTIGDPVGFWKPLMVRVCLGGWMWVAQKVIKTG